MSKFTKQYKEVFKFDGDEVECVLSQLKRVHLMQISPELRKGDDTFAILEAAKNAFNECIVSISGLKNSDGVQLAVNDIIDEAYFSPLMMDILNSLLLKSSVGRDAEKKSDQESVTSSQELKTI